MLSLLLFFFVPLMMIAGLLIKSGGIYACASYWTCLSVYNVFYDLLDVKPTDKANGC